MRLGATMAACQAAAATPFASLVCWDPCLSGRTFLREGEALYGFGEAVEAPDDGLRHTPGFQYDADTAKAMRSLDFGKLPADWPLADRVLLLTRSDRPVPPGIVARLEQEGTRLETGVAERPGRPARRTPRAQRRPERRPARGGRLADRGRRRPACRCPSRRRTPSTRCSSAPAGGSRRCASGSPGSAPTASSAWSTSRSTCRTRRRAGRCRGWSWSTWPPSTTSGRAGAGSSGLGAGPHWATAWSGSTRAGWATARPRRVGEDDRAFAPEWIDDMRHVVTELAADGAQVGIVGLCSGSYSALEVAMWEHVDAVFAINPRLTLYPAAKGTAGLHRPPARGDAPQQAVRHPRPQAPDLRRRPVADLPRARAVARAAARAVAGAPPRDGARGRSPATTTPSTSPRSTPCGRCCGG